jgi:hypothetical protein
MVRGGGVYMSQICGTICQFWDYFDYEGGEILSLKLQDNIAGHQWIIIDILAFITTLIRILV